MILKAIGAINNFVSELPSPITGVTDLILSLAGKDPKTLKQAEELNKILYGRKKAIDDLTKSEIEYQKNVILAKMGGIQNVASPEFKILSSYLSELDKD